MKMVLAAAGAVMLTLAAHAQTAVTTPLESLAAAERAFAKRATEIGWRDAFLEFFDEESIALTPQPVSARERLRKQPPQPFSVAELTWEPRTGQIAASGELGWLTGPSTSLNRAAPDPKPRYGNYLSIWRRQGSGPWRVLIDVGTTLPAPAVFAPGFNAFTFENPYRGGGTKADAVRTLAARDRDLNARIAADGSDAAYRAALAPHARLHRSGHAPQVTRGTAADWFARHAPSMTATAGHADAAESGDLGYTYGTYGLTRDAPETGAYLRVWQRDAAGVWWIVAEVTQPAPPRP
jgi:ketosteroid isomerase-like protein